MNLYFIMAILISLTIVLSYLNLRFLKLDNSIALLVASLSLSLGLILLGHIGRPDIPQQLEHIMAHINFHDLLINGFLSFLLFAGALHIDLNQLKSYRYEVISLAFISTLSSTLLIGLAVYLVLPWFNLSIPLIYCLLFGAVISPTDPIAVLAIFRKVKAPDSLHVIVECESLFNDGVAIVIFLSLYHFAFAGQAITLSGVSVLFLQQAIGGLLYGALLGLGVLYLIKPLHHASGEVLMTLIIPTGGYALAQYLNISGALAVVVAGIVIGNHAWHVSISDHAKQHLDSFWHLIDELLNAILFLLIGLEMLSLHVSLTNISLSTLAIPLVLLVRFITVAIPMSVFKRIKQYPPLSITTISWGGLRGGLALALALALPAAAHRHLFLGMTYAIVLFAIIVQGCTIGFLAKRTR